MNILDKIVKYKREEVAAQKEQQNITELLSSEYFSRTCLKLEDSIKSSTNGIIAEFKRQSPSKGIINNKAQVKSVTKAYTEMNVAAISVLTDTPSFGGGKEDLRLARKVNPNTPILRKDFIVDEFQLLESKALGADIILLIASYLSKEELADYYAIATDLGMSVLHEVHSKEELDKIDLEGKIIGVNNRNLKTFEVDVQQSIELAKHIPQSCIKVSESGISSIDTIKMLRENDFQAFLIGENFMKEESPEKAVKNFIYQLER